jgi:3-oxoacyl-[acyl-carrier protein] reductase
MPRALVTGGASGIGSATVELLRSRGWEAIGLDLSAAEGVVVADVTDADSLGEAARAVGPESLDAVVAAAGIWDQRDDRYSRVDLEAWERTWRVNVTGAMLTLRTFEPLLGSGSSVVTLGSVAALAGMPRRDAYTASKGAIVALTRAWAADLIRRGIRVNCVCPGPTATPMTAAALGPDAAAVSLPLGRPADPDEVAAVIAALVDPQASYLNGAVIPVDGGLTAALGTVDLTPRPPREGAE